MTASIKGVKTSYVTVNRSKTKKLNEKTREQLGASRKHWKRKKNEIRGEEDRLKRTKTASYLTGTLMMDKEQRCESVLKELQSKKRPSGFLS